MWIPPLWIRLQTKANHLAAFCSKRWERCLIINLYFIPFLYLDFKLYTFIFRAQIVNLWWRSHLVTGQGWTSRSYWSWADLCHLDNTCTPSQTAGSLMTKLSPALHGTCRRHRTLVDRTFLCLKRWKRFWYLMRFYSMYSRICFS